MVNSKRGKHLFFIIDILLNGYSDDITFGKVLITSTPDKHKMICYIDKNVSNFSNNHTHLFPLHSNKRVLTGLLQFKLIKENQ